MVSAMIKNVLRPWYWGAQQRLFRWCLDDDSLFAKHIKTMSISRVAVAAVTICNARCVFCNYKTNEEPRLIMEEDVFRRAIQELNTNGFDFFGYGGNSGDGLCDPYIGDRVLWAKQNGIRHIFLGTNGILLNKPGLADKLVRGCDQINLSVPGFDRENYKTVYGVDKVEQLIDGIRVLAEAKRVAKSSVPILLCFRISRPWSEVKAETEALFAEYLTDGTLAISESVNSEAMFNLAGEVKEEDMVGDMHVADLDFKPYYPPCRRPLEEFTVLVDGQVRACNCIYEKTNWDDLVIGDIKAEPLDKILFGPRHRALLRRMANQDWPDVCSKCNVNHAKRLGKRAAVDIIQRKLMSLLAPGRKRASSPT